MLIRKLRRASIGLSFLLFGLWVVDKTNDVSTSDVVSNVTQSIVEIKVVHKQGMGGLTGFVISDQGYILTAAHGFSSNNNPTTVFFYNDYNIPYEAEIVKKSRRLDIAILYVPDMPKDIPALQLSSDIGRGEPVVAIGHPLWIPHIVTEGLFSGYMKSPNGYPVLQFSAPIDHGNSGGPVLNMKSQVVGMTVAMARGGVSIAVPSDILHAYARNIPGRNYGQLHEMSNSLKKAVQSLYFSQRRETRSNQE